MFLKQEIANAFLGPIRPQTCGLIDVIDLNASAYRSNDHLLGLFKSLFKGRVSEEFVFWAEKWSEELE